MSRIMHEVLLQVVCASQTKSLGSPSANKLFSSLQTTNIPTIHIKVTSQLFELDYFQISSHHTSLKLASTLARTFRFTFPPSNMVSVELEKPVQVVVRIEIPTEAQLVQRRKPRTPTWITHSAMSAAECVAPNKETTEMTDNSQKRTAAQGRTTRGPGRHESHKALCYSLSCYGYR